MANSRYLSICKLFTAFLISTMISGIGFADTPQAQSAFRERDIMISDLDKEWVFQSLLQSAINADTPKKLWAMAPNDEIRNSLTKIRNARYSKDSMVQVNRISDLVYAYSWSDTWVPWFLGGSVGNVYNRIADVSNWIDTKTNYKKEFLGTIAAIAGISTAGAGLKKFCKKAAPVPNGQPAQAPVVNKPGLKTRMMNFFTDKLPTAAGAVGGWFLAHPLVLGSLAAFEVCVDAGNIYIAGPYALDYYTDRIILGSDSLHVDSWANTVYGYQDKSGQEYYRGYINMDTFYKLLKGILNFESAADASKAQFGYATTEMAQKVNQIYRAAELYGQKKQSSVLRFCATKKTTQEFKTCTTANREEIKGTVFADECRKYTFFNRSLHPDDSTPLFMLALCGSPENDAQVYAKMPGLKGQYARMPKDSAADFINDIITYTGSTVVASQAQQ